MIGLNQLRGDKMKSDKEASWVDEVELKPISEIGKPIFKFVEGHNVLYLDLSKPPRDASTKFGLKKVFDGRTEDGQEVSVFLPAGATESSSFGQCVKIAKEFGAKEHLLDIIAVGKGRNRRLTILHSSRCGCKK